MQSPITFDLGSMVEAGFFVLLFIFTLYGIFLAYHWFQFGTSKHTSLIALATYLLGGAVLFLTLAWSMRLIS